ncbi:MAG: TerB family tellurite resistance protein [Rhodobacteraceae bacterium]|nr:TerB family tellurite resistance protein [Paracoccaceae bacterium]
MFDTLFKRLRAEPAPDPLEANDARLALAALLVRLARTDHDYASSEKEKIDEILSQRYKMQPAEAATLRAGAEDVEATAGDTVHLTRLIKAAIPYDDRIALVIDLWRLVLADGTRDHAENQFLRLVVKLVGVNDVDSGMARQQAAKS